MNKEYLEALERIKKSHHTAIAVMGCERDYETENAIDIIEKELQRLESIDNAKPSEAMECIDYIEKKLGGLRYECERTNNHRCDDLFIQEHIFTTIKQTLIKAQEQDFNYKNIVIPFFDELVKLLGTNDTDEMLDKIKEQEKVLSIIKEKRIDIESFYKTFIEDNYDYKDYEICYGTYGLKLLTEEEFDLLKRWLG